MPSPAEWPQVKLFMAEVKSTDPENRMVDVSLLGLAESYSGVIVVNDSNSYSFPKVGDRGIIIQSGQYSYYLGKIEFRFKDKLDGKVKDKTTGTVLKPKHVRGGETWIGNLARRAWMEISNSGNFSLMNGLNDGLKYFKKSRFLRLAGGAVNLVGNGAYVAFGSVMRDLPGVGKTPIPGETGTSIEGLINLAISGLRLARFHIGNVMDTTLGTPELGSWGARLRAILEVCTAGVPIAWLKVDESGNIEIKSTATNIAIEGGPAALVQLGGLSATEPIIKGSSYISTETTFLTAVQTLTTSLIAACGLAAGAPNPLQNQKAIEAIAAAVTAFVPSISTYSSNRLNTLSTKIMCI